MIPNHIENIIYRLEEYLYPTLGNIDTFEIYYQKKLIFSEIIKVRLYYGQVAKNVVLKRFLHAERPNTDLSGTVEHEYKILTHLYNQFSFLDHINVIEPLAHLSDEHILVTEDFPGNNLNTLILSHLRWVPSTKELQRLNKYCFLSGRWLRYFQQFTRKDDIFYLDRDQYVVNIEKKLASSRQFSIGQALSRKIYKFVDSKFTVTPFLQLQSVGYHSDFTPWNILIKDDEIRVCDFDRFSFKSKYDDLTLFLCCLEAQKGILGMSNRHIDSLKNSYLTGYNPSNLQNDTFQLYLLKNTLKCLNWIDLYNHTNFRYLDIQYEKFRKKRELKTLRKYLTRLLNAS